MIVMMFLSCLSYYAINGGKPKANFAMRSSSETKNLESNKPFMRDVGQNGSIQLRIVSFGVSGESGRYREQIKLVRCARLGC